MTNEIYDAIMNATWELAIESEDIPLEQKKAVLAQIFGTATK
jgi:hypothetical protein